MKRVYIALDVDDDVDPERYRRDSRVVFVTEKLSDLIRNDPPKPKAGEKEKR